MWQLCLHLLHGWLSLGESLHSDWAKPLPLLNSGNDYYYVRALVGTPGQELPLLVDIAHPFVQVEEEGCRGCSAYVAFNRNGTKSFRKEKGVVINGAAGDLGQELIYFSPDKSFLVENQTIAVMREDSEIQYHGMAGTLGLGFEEPSMGDLNLLQNLKVSGVIDKAVFAVYLNIDSLGWIPRESSSISFGSWNLSRYSTESEFTYVAADLSGGNWSVPLSNAEINSVSIDFQPRRAVITSAQSRLVAPWIAYNGIYNHVCYTATCMNRKGVYWNCTRYPQSLFGDLTFSLGSVPITLTAYDYIESRGEHCYLQVKTMDGVDYWMLGTAFMKRYYLLFDAEERQIGVALAKHESDMSPWLFWLLIVIGIGVVVLLLLGVGFTVVRKYSRGQPLLQNRA